MSWIHKCITGKRRKVKMPWLDAGKGRVLVKYSRTEGKVEAGIL